MSQAAPDTINSTELQQTTIVPALECSIPPHQNVIWCSSFQLAWNQVSPLQIEGAEAALITKLNESDITKEDLEPDSYYATAGPCTKDAADKIQQDLERRFESTAPSYLLERSPDRADHIRLYAYLSANVPFEHPFLDLPDHLVFKDSQGKSSLVSAFGIPGDSHMGAAPMQVQILHRDPEREEFILDLSAATQPYQIVVAKFAREDTLADSLEALKRRVSAYGVESEGYPGVGCLFPSNSLSVPNLEFNIAHLFRELEVSPIAEAAQRTRFKLDRFGAELESEADLKLLGLLEGDYILDGPFLIRMMKRGCPRPFFVMWVDNAEFMSPVSGVQPDPANNPAVRAHRRPWWRFWK